MKTLTLVKDGKKCTCKNAKRIYDGEYQGKKFFSCSVCHRVSIINVTDELHPLMIKKRIIELVK